jgi:nucleotide-binding universal stress UspA family protein
LSRFVGKISEAKFHGIDDGYSLVMNDAASAGKRLRSIHRNIHISFDDGNRDGGQNGYRDGTYNGYRDGVYDGVHNGVHNGSRGGSNDGIHDGARNGTLNGVPNGVQHDGVPAVRPTVDSEPASAARSVLVPLDGSRYAERAIGPAIDLAGSLGLKVGIAQVVAEDRFANETYLAGLAHNHKLGWWQVVVNLDAVSGLHELAEERASMICMSTHGHGRAAAIVGSTAEELSLRSTLPVVLIGRVAEVDYRRRFDRLVVPLDGTPESEAAYSLALPWARQFGMPLELVTVVEQVLAPLREDHPPAARYGPDGDPGEYLDSVLDRIPAAGAAVSTRVQFDPISPASGMADLLRDTPNALVVVATHARTGFPRFVHGSIAGNIVDHSPVPVIEFRTFSADL